ncbi:MAG TPA: ISAs1 family transposase [Candidatus Paceibacterota bacterium]|nr:ISAs1 family transposase [Verrucomicrobiota bacterium]HSA13033.1 ISAs1 family transposase [Candidatus Paceibacterota bacterium]
MPEPDEQVVLDELQVVLVPAQQKAKWDRLVGQHHYLKSARLVGEQLRYAVTDASGRWLALIGWSAPALHLKARDQSIEWTDAQRQARLHLLAQNSRFVILGDRQQLPNLATRAMARCLSRLSSDWQKAYGHPIVMVESFVDRQLFRGTAYKAGGWEALGYSSGFKRVSEDFYQRHDRPKQLWVKALDQRAWDWLRAERLPAHLARYQKPVPPACPVAGQAVESLWERFERVPEWREPKGKRHKLPTVLTIIALACLAGVGQGYRAVSRFARRLTRLQRRALRCWVHPDTGRLEVPSEAVFQRVLQAVPRQQVEAILLAWQEQVLGPLPASDAVVIDGKEVCGGGLMLVNAVAQPSQRGLGLEPVACRTNEIPTARTLIERLALTGRLVQMDGMHTQHQTVQQILYEKGADYSLILRENQPTLLKTAQTLLPESVPPSGPAAEPTPGTPGISGGGDPHD